MELLLCREGTTQLAPILYQTTTGIMTGFLVFIPLGKEPHVKWTYQIQHMNSEEVSFMSFIPSIHMM